MAQTVLDARTTAGVEARVGSSVSPEGSAPVTGVRVMNESQNSRSPSVDWHDLVARIQANDESAMEELYRLFSKGIRFYLCRQLGPQELDDRVHDAFLIVVQAVRRGDLREPERLMGFVRTVVRRQVAAAIDRAVHDRRDHLDLESTAPLSDHRLTPEQEALDRERTEILRKVMEGISERDREILTRFYLLEQTQEQICREMHLSATQFRLLKSRAKARFGEQGRKRYVRRAVDALKMKLQL
jgi:RNA polymerase sigma-70 factor, ECF subfamily